MLSLVKICNVVLQRKIKTRKVYENDNIITTANNRHILIRKAPPSLLLRRAKIKKKTTSLLNIDEFLLKKK